jgi:hypothetical protein
VLVVEFDVLDAVDAPDPEPTVMFTFMPNALWPGTGQKMS